MSPTIEPEREIVMCSPILSEKGVGSTHLANPRLAAGETLREIHVLDSRALCLLDRSNTQVMPHSRSDSQSIAEGVVW